MRVRAGAALAGTRAVVVATALLTTACGGDPAPPAAPPPRTATPAITAPAVAGPTVREIADALDTVSPLRHPRDNTGSCAAKAGCVGLVTTGAVSIYQWPDVSAAGRYIGEGGNADRIGPYVLSYRTREQRSTPPEVRKAYADTVRALVGPVP